MRRARLPAVAVARKPETGAAAGSPADAARARRPAADRQRFVPLRLAQAARSVPAGSIAYTQRGRRSPAPRRCLRRAVEWRIGQARTAVSQTWTTGFALATWRRIFYPCPFYFTVPVLLAKVRSL